MLGNRHSEQFLEYLNFIRYMELINNIVYEIQCLTISLILDPQENIYKEVKETYYMSAGEAGRPCSGFWVFKYRCFFWRSKIENIIRYDIC